MDIPNLMNAVVALGPGEYEYRKIPVPIPGGGDMLIRMEICGICAGDVKASHGTSRFWGGDGMPEFCKPPFVPGHEFVGRVVATGNHVKGDFKIGDRVVSEQIVPCGECYYCKRNMHWLCEPHDVYGFKNYLNGGMAEYILLPENSVNYHVPEELSSEQAVLIEPFACSLHGVRQSKTSVDDVVVLAGAGTLGLGMVNALRKRNPRKLIVLDMIEKRLELAKQFGADIIINPAKEDALKKVLEITQGVGCDIYIEATGHPSAVQQGLDMIRKGGTFVEFSVMSGPSTIDWSIIGDAKEITITGSQLSPYCFDTVIEDIRNGTMKTDGVVTHLFELKDWKAAYAAAQTKDALKVAFKP